ncbi:hypothetical protein LELG_00276 [Lodderomyces elongisporus NRRL YB-4239]|uniref:Uncharacterized protein n=1 Tax=Lodderomyces elongisporus (strain ATCC 11503 / CBS 2605 / JCM 1781 / NBRC 1676 / NRRL YB-4239) TaxID=379508 RepID=A5DSE0_LODEL|nr:hypothetical protein LELG_00276 [Lodderomyces elongisporus NRRL YB-4239]
MSSVRKVNNYLDQKKSLTTSYLELDNDLDISPEQVENYLNLFFILKKLDEYKYEYTVAKSYIDSHKDGTISVATQELLNGIELKIKAMEDEIDIQELISEAPKLSIIRKQLEENAIEGGKLIYYNEQLRPDIKQKFLDEQMYQLKA